MDLIEQKSFSQTHCAICYGPFGEAHRQNPEDEVVTAMLKCGHLFCIGCVEEYRQRKELERQVLKCPSCRQDFHLRDVIHIDHIHKPKQEMKAEQAKREQAKATIREASDMLSSSDGVLDGDLWESLYRSIDLPVGIDARSHGTYTALDPNFFAHLRSACALNAASKPSDTPCSIDDGLSSKVRALLVDLPLGEHAVVFSTSKVGVLHLKTVLNAKSIPVFSIHVGQKAEVTELAVTSWQNEDLDSKVTGPVLIVQAGAAASGLTLTAACKLFLLEPFQRIEEEQVYRLMKRILFRVFLLNNYPTNYSKHTGAFIAMGSQRTYLLRYTMHQSAWSLDSCGGGRRQPNAWMLLRYKEVEMATF